MSLNLKTDTGYCQIASLGSNVISGSEVVHYSTEERVIRYWTDGKPVYRKIFHGGTPTPIELTYFHKFDNMYIKDISNIDTALSFAGSNNVYAYDVEKYDSVDITSKIVGGALIQYAFYDKDGTYLSSAEGSQSVSTYNASVPTGAKTLYVDCGVDYVPSVITSTGSVIIREDISSLNIDKILLDEAIDENGFKDSTFSLKSKSFFDRNKDANYILEYTKITDTPVAAINTYSTEESLTGKTWIDGSPIYRKVFTGLNLNTSRAWTLISDISVPNITRIINSAMYREYENFFDEAKGWTRCNINTGDIYYFALELLNPGANILVLEYTKMNSTVVN